MNTQECEACKGKFAEDDMTDDAGDGTLMCWPCWYNCECCYERRIDHDYENGICDKCNDEMAQCQTCDKYFYKHEMKEEDGKYYCADSELPKVVFTGKRRKRILPPKKCDECGDVVHEDDITEMHGKVVCESCRCEVRTCDDEKCDECSARHWHDDCAKMKYR